MKLKTLSGRVDLEWDKARADLDLLCEKAGIASKVEKAGNSSWSIGPSRHAVVGTDRLRHQLAHEHALQHQSFRLQLRRIVFAVQDDDLRQRLMDGFHESEKQQLDWFEARLQETNRDCNEAKARGGKPWWWFASAIFGMVAVWLGHEIYQTAGAVAGAVVAYFFGRGAEATHLAARDKAVRSAQEEMNSCAADVEEMRKRDPLFTAWERVENVRTPTTDGAKNPDSVQL